MSPGHIWEGPPLHLSSRKKRCVKLGELRKKEKLCPRQLKITNYFFSNYWNTSGEGGRGREMEVLMLEDIKKDRWKTRIAVIWFPKLFCLSERKKKLFRWIEVTLLRWKNCVTVDLVWGSSVHMLFYDRVNKWNLETFLLLRENLCIMKSVLQGSTSTFTSEINRDTVWQATRKRKSSTSLNF